MDEKLTVYEKEQLDKKKEETKVLFQEKCKVILDNFNLCLQNHPELIGFIPFCPAEDQITNAFDNWLHQHNESITKDVVKISNFLSQISTLRADAQDWQNFVHGWKLHRILYNDEFAKTWNWVVQELNVELHLDKMENDSD